MKVSCEIHGETEGITFWNGNPPTCKQCSIDLSRESREGKERNTLAFSKRVGPVAVPLTKRIEAARIPTRFNKADANADNKRWIKAHEASWGACLLLGNVGPGKTHQACGMLIHGLILGRSALYTTARKMSRAIIEDHSVEKFTSVHYLVIDEMGRGFDTEAEENRMFEVIDDRYMSGKPVILVGNVDNDELKGCIGAAAADRLREDLKVITMTGESRRTT